MMKKNKAFFYICYTFNSDNTHNFSFDKDGSYMGQTKIRVINRNGKTVAANGYELGEVIVKGNGVRIPPNDEASFFNDGWLYTGDIGVVHSDGSIEITERRKDLQVDNEEAFSTVDVELLLQKHQHIYEVAATITPDKEKGDMLEVFIVTKDNTHVSEKGIIQYIKEDERNLKVPGKVTFLEELPKTVSGKLLRRQLKSHND